MKYTASIFVILLLAILTLTGCTSSEQPGYFVNPPGTPIEVEGISVTTSPEVTIKNTPLPVDVSQSDTYFAALAEREIAGHSAFLKLGFNNAVGTIEEDIWYASSTYVFPTVAQRMMVHSSNNADNATGTGIQKVILYYLDDTYAEQQEIVTMNGATFVQTVADNILRINGFRAYTTGTGYKAAGHIDLRNLGDTVSYSYIPAGYTRARNSAYTVPLGKTLYIQNLFVGVGGLNSVNECRITLRATYDDYGDAILTAGLFFMPYIEVITPNGSVDRHFDIPLRFPAMTDIKVSGLTDVGTAIVEIAYRGWIEDN